MQENIFQFNEMTIAFFILSSLNGTQVQMNLRCFLTGKEILLIILNSQLLC